jgi:saccharopine dehydrogenase (NAD+, L-lysine-forming)
VVGTVVAEILCRREDVQVVLLGRNVDRLTETAAALGGERVSIVQTDATDPVSLRAAFAPLDLVVVAAPLLDRLEPVVQAALDTGTDWVDVLLDTPEKWEMFDSLASRFEADGRIGLVGSGIHPGLPAVLIRAAAARKPLTKAEVGMIVSMDWSRGIPPETAKEFTLEMANMKAGKLSGGQWRKLSWMSPKTVTKIDFGEHGKRSCAYMALEEIRRLPSVLPQLRDAGLAVSGFSPLVDYLLMPLAMVMTAISKRLAGPAARMMVWGLVKTGKPPYDTILRLDADGVSASVTHADSYWLTAAVAALTATQILDGHVPPGVQPAALAVNPEQLLDDLAALGTTVNWS